MMVSPKFLKCGDAQIGSRIMYKWILTTLLTIMIMVDLVRKMKESFVRALTNLEKYSGVRIPNAPESLEGGHVGLKFQFKMLGRWSCWNELRGNEAPGAS